MNKELQSYKKIERVTVVDEPFPMTSTKKVKRFLVKSSTRTRQSGEKGVAFRLWTVFRALFLRTNGQTLSPVVMVGKNVFDDRVAAQLDLALKAQVTGEGAFPIPPRGCGDDRHQLADKVGGEVITKVGFNLLIYRDGEHHLLQEKYQKRS
jgi:RNA-binding protein YhbY